MRVPNAGHSRLLRQRQRRLLLLRGAICELRKHFVLHGGLRHAWAVHYILYSLGTVCTLAFWLVTLLLSQVHRQQDYGD